MRKAVRFRDCDLVLLGLALAIAAVGIVELYSTTAQTVLEGQFRRQVYWVLLGSLLALVVARFDYHLLLEQVPWLYGVTILGLGALLVLAERSPAPGAGWLSAA